MPKYKQLDPAKDGAFVVERVIYDPEIIDVGFSVDNVLVVKLTEKAKRLFAVR
jgi:hypothetical protein